MLAAKFRIDTIDMYLRDQRALEILKESADPVTGRVSIDLHQLAKKLGCHHNTAISISSRLAGAGHIRKTGKGHGQIIEVLCPASTTTKPT